MTEEMKRPIEHVNYCTNSGESHDPREERLKHTETRTDHQLNEIRHEINNRTQREPSCSFKGRATRRDESIQGSTSYSVLIGCATTASWL